MLTMNLCLNNICAVGIYKTLKQTYNNKTRIWGMKIIEQINIFIY